MLTTAFTAKAAAREAGALEGLKNSMIALILSILLPGLGQFYYGKNVRAIFMILLTFTPLYPIALIWSIIDVIILGKKEIKPRFSKKEAVWAIVILLVLIPVAFFLVFTGMLSIGQWYTDKYVKPNTTVEEGYNIASAIHRYHRSSGEYPTDIYTLIGNTPVRSGWKTDSWGEPYIYELEKDGQNFKLLSKGKDRILGTEDDIVFK